MFMWLATSREHASRPGASVMGATGQCRSHVPFLAARSPAWRTVVRACPFAGCVGNFGPAGGRALPHLRSLFWGKERIRRKDETTQRQKWRGARQGLDRISLAWPRFVGSALTGTNAKDLVNYAIGFIIVYII